MAILLSCSFTRAQEKEIESYISVPNSFKVYKKLSTYNYREAEEISAEQIEYVPIAVVLDAEGERKEKLSFAPAETENKAPVEEKDTGETAVVEEISGKKSFSETEAVEKLDQQPVKEKEKFHWKPALIQSGILLGIQHGFRLTQEKTTRELGGKFFPDWARSVKNLRGWEDGDNFFTNYIAHPLQGAATGRIFINNSDRAKKQEFGKSKTYWESRFKAMVWSAVWSTQFEMGPISEATIGNVGMREFRGRSTMAYVDLVVTPVAGTGILIAEDAIDKYFLKNWLERKTGSKTMIKLMRSLFTPTTSFVNLLRGRMPWSRSNRPL